MTGSCVFFKHNITLFNQTNEHCNTKSRKLVEPTQTKNVGPLKQFLCKLSQKNIHSWSCNKTNRLQSCKLMDIFIRMSFLEFNTIQSLEFFCSKSQT